MNIADLLRRSVNQGVKDLYKQEPDVNQIQFQKTKREFEGHITLVVFPLLKLSKKKPEETGEEIGAYLQANNELVDSYNVINGFLNLTISSDAWVKLLKNIDSQKNYGLVEVTKDAPLVMIEFSSPNTNKPLHLGHIRNNLLGYALVKINEAVGNRVVKTNIVNDRGIHICKSMLAWQKYGNGETPESSGKKGDHLVGDYYVAFDQHYKKELEELKAQGLSQEEAEEQSTLMKEAREMLIRWEQDDKEVRNLWNMMNGWVYEGFDETYKKLGVSFDKIYYESDTYLVGKKEVEEGLDKGVFYKKPDGSVWVDLSEEGLDQKILLRADGTSVYMTQDIGTAKLRFNDYSIDKMIYVVGNEQNYHFQVLSVILDKLGFEWGKDLVHFSYGMVELPDGKMKSREGTVVDADDLIDEMIQTAKESSIALGRLDNYTEKEIEEVARIVGLGALKYFILKVDARKNMTFDPKESIDFNGNTGPFIQYTHARICSIFRNAKKMGLSYDGVMESLDNVELNEKEMSLVQQLSDFGDIIKQAAKEYNPSLIANFIYDLVKEYNQFYHDYSILREPDESKRNFRLVLSANVAKIVRQGMDLLGIEVPEQM
ncbi:MAG: arginine--tRNA ligase [Bacteroidales bacterium]|nr:arginine--tRNA ligase [Bacteroidales bacterium]